MSFNLKFRFDGGCLVSKFFLAFVLKARRALLCLESRGSNLRPSGVMQSDHPLFERFLIRTGDGRTMVVHRPDGKNNNEEALFAQMHRLYVAFGFETSNGFSSYCSKKKVSAVENDDLKTHLRLRGIVRFVNSTGIKMLINERLIDEERQWALSDYQDALSGVTRSVALSDLALPALPAVVPRRHGAVALASAFRPLVLHPPPGSVPLRADEQAMIIPSLRLPRDDQWWDSSDYVIGKKFGLPDYGQSASLKTEVECYRMFWMEQDAIGRDGDALSQATLDKRVSRLLLYLGFLDLIKAVSDTKSLTLSACLSHEAVEKYCEWSTKVRQMLNSNIAENLSAMVSVCKFLYRNRPDATNNYAGCEIVQRYRTMRNRLTSKIHSMHKTSADLADEGRWLSWVTFREAIAELQTEFDGLADDDLSISSARLLMDLTMLRIYEASPCRSGEIRHLEYMPINDISAVKGKLTVSRWIGDSRKNVITRRELSCWAMFIGNSKTTKHHGVDEVCFRWVAGCG